MDATLYISYAAAILASLGVPVIVSARISGIAGSRWRLFLYGAAVYALVQAVRTPLIRIILATSLDRGSTVFLAVLAVSAGMLEELGRYAGYLFLFRGNLSRPGWMIYGLGHGWAECIAVAARMTVTAYLFFAISKLDLSAVQFTAQELEMIRHAKSLWFPLAGAFERLAMLPVHVMLSLIVLRSVISRRVRWILAAVAVHSAANLGIGLTMKYVGLLQGEILAAVVGACSLFVIRRLRMPDQPAEEPPESPPGTITLTG